MLLRVTFQEPLCAPYGPSLDLFIKTSIEPAYVTPKPSTLRPLSSSFWGLPYRILNINHKQELLRGVWVKP